jgi:hypothetical protein
MKFAATVYGTPDGFQDVFGTPDTNDRNDDVGSWVASFSAEAVYQKLGGLLRQADDDSETPTLWVVCREGIEEDPENELDFIGAYRPAFDTLGKRSGFYGAGYWFTRKDVLLPGADLQTEIIQLCHTVYDNCGKPVSSYLDKTTGYSRVRRMFSSTFDDRRTRLADAVDNSSNRLSGSVTELDKDESVLPRLCKDDSRAFVKIELSEQDLKQYDGNSTAKIAHLDAVSNLLDLFQTDRELLQYEVVFASTDQDIADDIENWRSANKKSIVPNRLQDIPLYVLKATGDLVKTYSPENIDVTTRSDEPLPLELATSTPDKTKGIYQTWDRLQGVEEISEQLMWGKNKALQDIQLRLETAQRELAGCKAENDSLQQQNKRLESDLQLAKQQLELCSAEIAYLKSQGSDLESGTGRKRSLDWFSALIILILLTTFAAAAAIWYRHPSGSSISRTSQTSNAQVPPASVPIDQ